MFSAKEDRVIGWSEREIEILEAQGEFFAAGFLKEERAGIPMRIAQGYRNHFSKGTLPPYTGSRMYPSGPKAFFRGLGMYPEMISLAFDRRVIQEKMDAAGEEKVREVLAKMLDFSAEYPALSPSPGIHAGMIHSTPDYAALLAHGYSGIRERIQKAAAACPEDEEKQELYAALRILVDSVLHLTERVQRLIAETKVEGQGKVWQDKLVCHFLEETENGAISFRSAMRILNFAFYLDGADNIGRLDQLLLPYCEMHCPDEEEQLEWIVELYHNIDDNSGFNITLAGTNREGKEASNRLTILCLKAGKGLRRPNICLRVRPDMPDEVWEAALECMATGTGSPALYNEEEYIRAIEESRVGVSRQDVLDYAFCGCTETLIPGRSCVGSTEAKIHLLSVLERTMYDYLCQCPTFESFKAVYFEKLRDEIAKHARYIYQNQQLKAKYHPQMMRTLTIADCIENGREFAAGGARYNWSIATVIGIGNVVDSLAAIKKYIYEEKQMHPAAFSWALANNYQTMPKLHDALSQLPKFGNDDPETDLLAREFTDFILEELHHYAPWRGGRIVGGCIMFNTYTDFGKMVGATPDGRMEKEAVSDSGGAVQGRDHCGPTAFLNSITEIPQYKAMGTLVQNIRFTSQMFEGKQEKEKLIALFRTYFKKKGMMLQVNVLNREQLENAMAHPEEYGDLVVRLGGYSEYWKNLTVEMRKTILERTVQDY